MSSPDVLPKPANNVVLANVATQDLKEPLGAQFWVPGDDVLPSHFYLPKKDLSFLSESFKDGTRTIKLSRGRLNAASGWSVEIPRLTHDKWDSFVFAIWHIGTVGGPGSLEALLSPEQLAAFGLQPSTTGGPAILASFASQSKKSYNYTDWVMSYNIDHHVDNTFTVKLSPTPLTHTQFWPVVKSGLALWQVMPLIMEVDRHPEICADDLMALDPRPEISANDLTEWLIVKEIAELGPFQPAEKV
jgi:hypothetical protein